jgi:hypothetical protein
MTSKPRLNLGLKAVSPPLYLAFVFLWFRHNFPALRGIRVSPLWAFIPLAAVALVRLLIWAKSARVSLPADWRRDAAALGLLILLATATHVPYLSHSFGLMDSDEAVPALMGKHIAEGRPAPLYFYGANFQGSLPEHYSAILYRIFGYSVFLAKLSAFLAFVAFLVVQFLLLKKAFSFGFACAVGAFYVLPWVELTRASFDIGSGYPVVLFFGTLILYLTRSVIVDGRHGRLAGLGFVLGLAFWTHQIIFIFALAAAPFLVCKFRLRLKPYLTLAAYALVGAFPVLLNEFATGFPLVRFLVPGEAGPPLSARLVRTRRLVLALFTSDRTRLAQIAIAVLALGIATLVILAIAKKIRPAALIYPTFFVLFLGVYIVSRFSSTDVIRYMYVLYVAIPVLFAAPFLWIRSRARYPAIALFLALVFAAGQIRASGDHLSTVRADHRAYAKAVAAMIETGEKYWIGNFWTSYLLTSLAGEKIIVASYTVRRYYPYELWYWSAGRNNWVLAESRKDESLYAAVLPDTLDKLGVGYEKKVVGGFTLVYRIRQDVFPRIVMADPPGATPDIRLSKLAASKGRLDLEFTRTGPGPTPGLGFRVEVPGYCVRFVPMFETPVFSLPIPFPLRPAFSLRYGLTYAGFSLEGLTREQRVSLDPADLDQPRPPIEFLEGIGPQRDVRGRAMFICRRQARIEINEPVDTGRSLALDLYSPFDFADPFWYGDFAQSVSIFVNDRSYGERLLGDGRTRILIKLGSDLFRGRGDIVRLEFKYEMPVSFNENLKTAAFLERIGFE